MSISYHLADCVCRQRRVNGLARAGRCVDEDEDAKYGCKMYTSVLAKMNQKPDLSDTVAFRHCVPFVVRDYASSSPRPQITWTQLPERDVSSGS